MDKNQKISPEQFSSFIDQEYKKPEVKKIKNIHDFKKSAEVDLMELIEKAKTEDEDVWYELIDLKKKELAIIYNYIKHR